MLQEHTPLSMSFDRPSTFDPTKTQWEALTKEKFDGVRCCFGQLVWYRLKSVSWKENPRT